MTCARMHPAWSARGDCGDNDFVLLCVADTEGCGELAPLVQCSTTRQCEDGFCVSYECDNDDAEPNDEVTNAFDASSSSTVSGRICRRDRDHYDLGQLEMGTFVSVTVTSDVDLDLRLYEDGTEMVRAFAVAQTAQLTWQTLATSNVVVRVESATVVEPTTTSAGP